jgi:hypothetical protein
MKTPSPSRKPRKNRQFVTLEILRRRFQVFVEADKEITKRAGSSPGVEALMTLQLETEDDPSDLAARYCFTVLKWPFERVREFSDPIK